MAKFAPTTELGGDTLRKAVAANERKKKRAKTKRQKPGVSPGERGPGRPSKLTDDVREEIVEAIKMGCYPEIAAEAAGVSPATYYRWMEEGAREEAEPEFREFRESVTRARAFSERADIALIDAAANAGDWRAAAWKRGQSSPERWRKAETPAPGTGGAPTVNAAVTFRIEYVNNWREAVKMEETNAPEVKSGA
jgi:hypothetical protein